MLTLETLTTYVEKWLDAECQNDEIIRKEWNAIKRQMEPHYGPIFVKEDEIGEELVNGYASTYFEEFYDLCWKLGCTVWCHYDYYDGSPTYYISLPDTEEEYRKNVAEGTENWKEITEEEN